MLTRVSIPSKFILPYFKSIHSSSLQRGIKHLPKHSSLRHHLTNSNKISFTIHSSCVASPALGYNATSSQLRFFSLSRSKNKDAPIKDSSLSSTSTIDPSLQSNSTNIANTSSSTTTTDPASFPSSSVDPFIPSSTETTLATNSSTASSPLLDTLVSEPTTSTYIPSLIHHLGDLKALGLASSYTPVGWVQQALEWLHVNAGLPWWGSIMALTIALRICLLPLMLRLQHQSAILNKIRPQLTQLTAEIKEARKNKHQLKAYNKSKELQKLFEEQQVKPFKAILMPLIQTPILISFFFAIRKLSEAQVPSFINEKFLWLSSLSVPDPYMILPITAAGLIFTMLELGADTGGAAQTPGMKLIGRGFALGMIPLTYTFPSAIHLYWCTSSFFSLLQLQLFKSSYGRSLVGLPPLQGETLIPRGERTLRPMGFFESFRTVHALKPLSSSSSSSSSPSTSSSAIASK